MGGMADDTHLAPTARDSTAHMLDAVSLPDPGYEMGDVLGRGGMGEVIAAQHKLHVQAWHLRKLLPAR